MSAQTLSAHLGVQLKHEEHSMADVAMVVESLYNLVVAGLWASMLHPRINDQALIRARQILQADLQRPKTADRFYPGFGEELLRFENVRSSSLESEFGRRFDPYDPLDSGLQIGVSSWFRRVISRNDPQLEKDLFSFAYVNKVRHQSPLLIEMAVVIGIGTTLPALLVYSLMKAISRGERQKAEAEIRLTEVQLKREELNQQKLRTRILEQMADAINEMGARNQLEIPREVLLEAARIASPSVADLEDSPLIGQITLGISGIGGSK